MVPLFWKLPILGSPCLRKLPDHPSLELIDLALSGQGKQFWMEDFLQRHSYPRNSCIFGVLGGARFLPSTAGPLDPKPHVAVGV